jgi:hypothetical protein
MSHAKPLIVAESIKEISGLRKGSSETQNKSMSMLNQIN